MTRVLITFHDGEVMHAETADLSFALPILDVRPVEMQSNSERALLPLSAIRLIIVDATESAPGEHVLREWDRAAFHFTDGHVLRLLTAPDAVLGVFGGMWHGVEPGSDDMRCLAIPYTSLKGIYQLEQWDSRPSGERGTSDRGRSRRFEQTVRVLAERDVLAGARRSAGEEEGAAKPDGPRSPAAARPRR